MKRHSREPPWEAGATLLALLVLFLSAGSTLARGEAMNDGLFLVYIDEGQMMTDSGSNATSDQPDLFISMPHVMLAGQPVAGAPAGEVEERACAAACRATSQCNIYFWCPAAEGCSTSLTNATGGSLPYRHCELAQQPNALPGQAHPPEAVDKGPAVAVTSGQIVPDMQPRPLEGYTLYMSRGWYNMYDYTCNGTLKPSVCMRQGSLEEARAQCEEDGAKCMGIKFFPLGRDYLGDNIYMLKGIPDEPTADNFPGVPIDLSLANWNGLTLYYAKDMSPAELAEASSYLVGSSPGSADGSGGLSAGVIAGIAVGAALGGLAALAAVGLVWRKRRRRHVLDAEAGRALRGLKVGSHPGDLSPADIASMSGGTNSSALGSSSGAGTACQHNSGPGKGPSGRGSEGGHASLGSALSSELSSALAVEMGQEWLVNVAQIKFVMDAAGEPTKLGAGAQGTVYQALLNGVEPVAVKVVPVGDATAAFLHEARMLRSLRHRNVVHLVGVALHGDKAMVLTEFMEGRDLFSMLPAKDKSGVRAFSWYKRGKRVALDVAAALAYLHNKRVMHFDIKASNVLLTRDLTAKLGDVGLSKALTHTIASQSGPVGTFAWCAPEVLMGKPCTFSADIYSFGVLLFEICTGEMPLRGRLKMPAVPEQCPQGVVDLILRCMGEDPTQRPTAAQLVEELSSLAGVRLPRGLLAGEEGLGMAPLGPEAGQAQGPSPPVDARRLAGVAAAPRAAQASPFS
ncbi:hypothetical protein ABPG77_001341 [Micractinium sp. CCAP 211/92]